MNGPVTPQTCFEQASVDPVSPMVIDQLPVIDLDLASMREKGFVTFDGTDQRSRPFKLLRAKLLRELAETNAQLIGITSPAPAAGKSFISTNLAASIAQVHPRPVVLVDLDLKRATVAKNLGHTVSNGVEEFLQGKITNLAETSKRVNGVDLIVIPARSVEGDSAEVINNQSLEKLFQQLAMLVPDHLVIFDLPPILANDDAISIIKHLDAYMMVIDGMSSKRQQVITAFDFARPDKCIGTIFNRYRGSILDQSGYGYFGNEYTGYYSK